MRGPLVSITLLVLGCASGSGAETGVGPNADRRDDPRDFVGRDAQVDIQELRFLDPAERQRFERARACLSKRGATWEHYPLRKIGAFVQEDWCRGEGAERGCSGGNFNERADIDTAGIGTLHYADAWPEVFGVQVHASHRPPPGDSPGRSPSRSPREAWNVSVSVSTNGARILGDGGSIVFERAGGPGEPFYVGTSYGYEIAQTSFQHTVDGDGWELLDRVRASPQALRDEALPQWDALEAKVLAALDAGEVLECVYGEYKGDGIPPACIEQVPLGPEAVARERKTIQAKVRAIHTAFERDASVMHAALLELAPTDCF